ncbi:DUF771 domain-containing protein [Companilactobacillus allii]|uniref:DUF771 domain-containing protein n=1 Tax=Companilactobacillus allii TaxID=1847728 RepID=A0A1P8Q2D4_9LACO|nr:DUF771 domain-containing protein [Companilactobacillus allii]APX72044.1 hypothetical protein BTM29_05480 [Companilactobacillus allii]USQ69136.1 DUF771 domain-containing protein [Companilactobacillus allii]
MLEAKQIEFEVIAEKDNKVLGWISKDTLHELQSEPESDPIENMKWATKITKVSAKTLKKILDQPFIKKELDMENGGYVRYAPISGSPWKFQSKKFKKFVDEHPQYFVKGRF